MNFNLNLTISVVRLASCSLNFSQTLRTFDTTKIANSTLLKKPIFNRLKIKKRCTIRPTGLNEGELKSFRQIDRLIQIVKSSKSNKNNRLILLEGKILIEEALKWPNVQLSHLFYTSKQKIDQLKLNLKEKERLLGGKVILHATNEFLINKWSHLQTNQGLLAVAKLKKEEIRNSSPSLPLTLVLDNIRDPGNMGTMIRTAAGVGCEKILLTKGSVNPWNPKVLRAAMGAHFRLPIYNRLNYDQILNFLKQPALILVADSQKDQINSIDYSDLTRILPKIRQERKLNIILVMSNETRGISDEMSKIEKEINDKKINNMLRVNISSNQVESLNCSIAFAILAYEIKRILQV